MKHSKITLPIMSSLLIFSLPAFACYNAPSAENAVKRYDASRQLARQSLALRVLKWSRCSNKVKISDVAEADLKLIRKNLYRHYKSRFDHDLMVLKQQAHQAVHRKIDMIKKSDDNLVQACHSLEAELKTRYEKAKTRYFKTLHEREAASREKSCDS